MTDRVLVIGGYGTFGARLSAALARRPGIEVLVAGRDLAAARAFTDRSGGTPVRLDRDDPAFAAVIAALAPAVMIDAAGPFQDYGPDPYRIARATLAAGAHYLDLSDDAAFTAGIVTLDAEALAAGRAVLSGVSSVPALSSAAVAALADGMADIHLIDTAILPGNRAPRGLSVVRAIAGQAGRPLRLSRGGRWTEARAWGWPKRLSLGPGVTGRWASFIGAPDLTLFPARFGARSVLFRAGLELKLMHGGLAALGLLPRLGLVRSLAPAAPALRRVADWLRPFGSDRGGMVVRVLGITRNGQAEERRWTLIAGAGDGPEIPAIPAAVMVERLLAGQVASGARACLAEFPLAAAETAMAAFDIVCETSVAPFPLIFEQALGNRFGELAPQVQDLHRVMDLRRWRGRARIDRGRGRVARLVARAMGFPPASDDVPVTVTMERRSAREIWTREFGAHRFRSVLSVAPQGGAWERFGPMSFRIALAPGLGGSLLYPLTSGRFLGLPLPRWLLPASDTREFVDAEGRVNFDVAISHPLTGPIVRYRGWLRDAWNPGAIP